MTPSLVRAELLGEHFELRRLMEEARAILEKDKGSEPARAELGAAVDRLAASLLRHSQHEEAALLVILASVRGRAHPDAIMDEHHVAEHAKLVAVLRAAVGDSDVATLRARVTAVLDELEAHMAYEEEVLLGEDLLGDEGDVTEIRS
jgi:iron-sulfur cluster repair protein YtfE (RIC family)